MRYGKAGSSLLVALLWGLQALGEPAAAQQAATGETSPPTVAPAAPAAAPEVGEVQELIRRMEERIRRMNEAAAERDRALEFLRKQVEEATALIGESSEAAQSLKERAAALATNLEDISKDRDTLSGAVNEREELLRALEQRVAALTDMLGLERPNRYALDDSLKALRGQLEARLAEESRRRGELEGKLGELEQTLAGERQAREQEVAALEQRLRQERDAHAAQRAALEKGVVERDQRIAALQQEVDVERNRVRALDQEIARLNAQLARMKELLVSLEGDLAHYGEREQVHLAQIADLQNQLTSALARKVEELTQYRSEFFGRLRQALADRPEIKIVGDRFVVPAELLFPSGSAQLEPEGQRELVKLAATLREVAATIPADIDWVLRVDGHTDRRPLSPESRYRSNWELSAARALTVVEFLVAQGIPPERLMAAGFGEYHPVDPGDSEEAYRRNRRIEFRLTQR